MIRKFARKVLVFLCCFLMGAVSIVAWSVYNNKKAEQGSKIEASKQTEAVKDNQKQKEDDVKSEEHTDETKEEKTEDVKEEKTEKKEDQIETSAPIASKEQGEQTLIPGFQQSLQQMSQELNSQNHSYDKLVQKLLPSVVHIKVVSLQEVDKQIRYGLLTAYEGEIFPPKKIKALASGSGFFISEDGYIVTNHHVIDDAQDIDVETHNGKKYKATLVGSDESADLAVLKIKPNKGEKFLAVPFDKNDSVAVGDTVIVIGGPLGYKWSVSSGIVSGKSRDGFRPGGVGEFIQIDAAVTHGNSGGPAFNLNGEVVGINDWGYEATQGMNFAISAKTALDLVPKLKKGKKIARGLFGISVAELEPWDVKTLGMEKNTGLLIHKVIKDGPAEKAGIKRGDVYLKMNGEEVKDQNSLIKLNAKVMAGETYNIEVLRLGQKMNFKVKAMDTKSMEKLEKGEVGALELDDGIASLKLLTRKMHSDYKLNKDIDGGVIVAAIKDNDEPMFMLTVGTIIVQINDMKINTIEEYQAAIKTVKNQGKKMAMFHVYLPVSQSVKVIGSVIPSAVKESKKKTN
ncbi:MAG: trypsin-like peptidase domain-containing protein [Rickettsiales bacterium]|nr:trypsin-like peptidase domain-containing protein [Rickettsiales bacterium]